MVFRPAPGTPPDAPPAGAGQARPRWGGAWETPPSERPCLDEGAHPMAMELPDEAVTYNYQRLLVPASEEWTVAAEARARQFLHPGRLKDLAQRLLQCKSQVAAERE